jgi:hypothetical protein
MNAGPIARRHDEYVGMVWSLGSAHTASAGSEMEIFV